VAAVVDVGLDDGKRSWRRWSCLAGPGRCRCGPVRRRSGASRRTYHRAGLRRSRRRRARCRLSPGTGGTVTSRRTGPFRRRSLEMSHVAEGGGQLHAHRCRPAGHDWWGEVRGIGRWHRPPRMSWEQKKRIAVAGSRGPTRTNPPPAVWPSSPGSASQLLDSDLKEPAWRTIPTIVVGRAQAAFRRSPGPMSCWSG